MYEINCHDEIKSLKRYLLYNKYPLDFVDISIRKVLEKLTRTNPMTDQISVPEPPIPPSSSEAPTPANTAPLDARVEIASHNSS